MKKGTVPDGFERSLAANTVADADPSRCLLPYPGRARSGRGVVQSYVGGLIASWPVMLVISCFGPYTSLSLGLRTEHFLIFGFLPFAFLRFISPTRRPFRDQWAWRMLWSLAGLLVWTAAVTLILATRESLGLKVVGSVENFAEPVAVLVVTYVAVRRNHVSPQRTLKAAASAYAVLMGVNAIVAAMCIVVDLSSYLRMFAGFAEVGGRTVMELAFTQGRYTGIFNQPSEAGLSYSVALLCWLYAYGRETRWATARTALFMLILAGGGLSTSKVFLFGGIPFFVAYAIRTRWHLHRVVLISGVCALAFAAVLPSLLERWNGTAQLSQMAFSSSDSFDAILARLSAGRLNGGGLVAQTFARVMVEAPLTGFGFGAEGGLDSAYNEVFFQGGTVALLFYFAFIAVSLRVSHVSGRTRESSLLLILTWLMLIAGLGTTVITANRVGSIIMTLMTIACCCQRNPRRPRERRRYDRGLALQRMVSAETRMGAALLDFPIHWV